MNVDSLICGRWVIPVVPENTVLEHHAIAVRDGTIIDILPAEQALNTFQAARIHRLPCHALIPGLVNAHTHAAMTLFRGIADDLPLMDWLNNYIWPAEQQLVAPEFITAGTQLAIAEMMRGGTTCFNDMYYFPDYTAEAAVAAGMRAVIGMIVLDFPTPWAVQPLEYFEKGEHVHDRFKNNPLIRTAFAPHAPYSVADESLRRIATLAEELDVPVHMHVHESADEINQSLERYGKRPLTRLHELDLLSQRLLAVHMTQLEPAEIDLVAKYGVNIIHCPESNLKLASGFCPVQELLGRGINVALGTDGCASNNDLDMVGETRTAALLAKGVAGDCSALPAASALKLATLNGARALGMDRLTGSLETGKQADVVALDLDCLETQPLYDPVSQIVYAAGRNQVTHAWIAGRPVLHDRELLTINLDQVKNTIGEWRERLSRYSRLTPRTAPSDR